MVEPYFLRQQAVRALRFASEATDPVLRAKFEQLALDYTAQADAAENVGAKVLGLDPTEGDT